MLSFLQRLNSEVLSKLGNVFRVYKTNFLPELVAKEARGQLRASSALQDDALLTFARDVFALYLRVCAAQFRRPHQEFVSLRGVFASPLLALSLSECLTVCSQGSEDDIYAIQSGDNESSIFDAGSAASDEYVVLMSVLKYFVSHVKEVDAVLPPVRLIGSAIEIVETCVRFQIERVFRKLRAETTELLANSHYQVNHLRQNSRQGSNGSNSSGAGGSNTGQSVQPVAQEVARSFTSMMQQVLRQMEPLAQTGASILREMSRLFSDLVQVGAASTCCCCLGTSILR